MGLITSQFREGALDPDHPMHQAAIEPDQERKMKGTAFNTSCITVMHSCSNQGEEGKDRKRNKKKLHTAIVKQHIENIPAHPLINRKPPQVHKTELTLPRQTRRTLAQLRAQKCPLLQGYLHGIGAAEDPRCPLCGHDGHDTAHLFVCPSIPTDLTPIELWRRPAEVADLLEVWQAALTAAQDA